MVSAARDRNFSVEDKVGYTMAFFLAYDPSTNPLNSNEWAFPVCEVMHIIGFATLIGTITMVDLRLLGVGMKKESAADLVRDTAPWTLFGLALVLISGPLIFSSDPNLYLANISFRFKITCLVLAIIYNYTIHRKVALSQTSGGLAAVVAVISLALWASVVFGGIFIAFV
ncbi:MAG: putative rane protein [Bryobacterales bacterium]|nr:putative rane protein [Bryobacterales bacterium]